MTITLRVSVKPNAKRQEIVEEPDGSLTVRLKSPPVDGKANAELVALLAARFGVPKAAVAIAAGHQGRKKLVRIEDG